MKKQIATWLSIAVIAVMSVLLILNYYLQLRQAEYSFEKNASTTIDQMAAIIEQNELDLALLTKDVKQEYIIRAQMAAYIVEQVGTETEAGLQNLTGLLDVDEVHLFDLTGEIYASSVNEYLGYNFNSGEQMNYFKPMLNNQDLVLCQDITPNTAKGKPMIYAAVWRADKKGIVQIGLEPERLIEAQSQNDLSYVFATMPISNKMNLYAITVEAGLVLGSTNDELVGQFDATIRNQLSKSATNGTSFYARIDEVDSICLFRQVDDIYIGVSQDKAVLNTEIIGSTLNVAAHIVLAGFVLLILLLKIIDDAILKNLNSLIFKMNQITGGNLDVKVNLESSPEFIELSEHVNTMVASLLATTDKLSQVLDRGNVNLAIYQYKDDMDRVLATSNMGRLLDLFPAEVNLLLANKTSFLYKLNTIKQNLMDGSDDVYDLDGRGEHFVRIESYTQAGDTYGVVVDVTDEVIELRRISYERDYDVLTDVYNRRAFLQHVTNMLQNEVLCKHAVLIALDMDNLKSINDAYGHASGDEAIRACAQIMKHIETPNKLVSRMGGDEFAVLIYGAQSKQKLQGHINVLEQAAKELYITVEQETVAIKLSAGYTFCTPDTSAFHLLEKQADEALYRAKRSGKAQFVAYES